MTRIEVAIVIAVSAINFAVGSAAYVHSRLRCVSSSTRAHAAAIDRAARAAFEREVVGSTEGWDPPPVYPRELCASANAVPEAWFVGQTSYRPSSIDGEDFNRGTPTTGWRCLRFEMTEPIRHRYRYERSADHQSYEIAVRTFDPVATPHVVRLGGRIVGGGRLVRWE